MKMAPRLESQKGVISRKRQKERLRTLKRLNSPWTGASVSHNYFVWDLK
jgi:hypothetical protein